MRETLTTKDIKRNIDNERHEEKHLQHKTHRETLTTKDRETLTTKDRETLTTKDRETLTTKDRETLTTQDTTV